MVRMFRRRCVRLERAGDRVVIGVGYSRAALDVEAAVDLARAIEGIAASIEAEPDDEEGA